MPCVTTGNQLGAAWKRGIVYIYLKWKGEECIKKKKKECVQIQNTVKGTVAWFTCAGLHKIVLQTTSQSTATC